MKDGLRIGKVKEWKPCPLGKHVPDGRIRAIGSIHNRYEQCLKCGKWLPVKP